MHQLGQDIRYAFRSLVNSPQLAAVAILTLSLGIGASTAVFSVVNTVLLQPLPYENPQRLALIWTEFGPDLPQNWISGPEFVEMREMNTSFEEIAVVVPFTVNVTGLDQPEEVNAAGASAAFFEVLGVQPAAGRLLLPEDDSPGATPIVLLRYGYWKARFGADRTVLGQPLVINGYPLTIAGVLPPNFDILHPDAQFPRHVDLWMPLPPVMKPVFGVSRYGDLNRGAHFLRGFGKLAQGVSLEQAQADMTSVAARMKEKSPGYYDFEGWGIKTVSLHDDLVEEVRPALMVLMGAVLFVLLIACVNVSNLLLTRAVGREREIAVRTTLGATRWRIARQLLTESVLLALCGGVGGILLGAGLLRGFALVSPDGLPRADEVALDFRVLMFTMSVCLVTGVLFGLAPAAHAWKRNLFDSLKEGARGTSTGLKGRRFRSGLVILETALALILLVGAGLMIKSFARLLEADPGYRSQHLLTFRISLPQSSYSTPAQISAFYDELGGRLEALPGVSSVGAISLLPLSGGASSGTTRVRESRTLPQDQRAGEIDRRVVFPGYFQTMGIRLLQGRVFSPDDRSDSPLVALVDEEFVKRFWPSENPVGQQLSINSSNGERVWREVVGVVAHSRHTNISTVGRAQVYFPDEQQPVNSMYFSLRTELPPSTLAPSVRQTLSQIDPDQPISDVATMESRVEASLSGARFNLLLLGGFAMVALLLAAIGIYGVLSYSTQSRRGEIGIRMALGADTGAVRGLVFKQGMTVSMMGLLLGIPAALALSRFLESLLYLVKPTDPSIYAAVMGVLLASALLACYLPARRATRVDPAQVLQSE